MATEEDKVNNGAIATLIAVIAFGVIAVALAVTALTRKEQSDEYSGKEGFAQAEYHALAKAQREALNKDDSIKNAMQTVVREIAKNPQSASPPASAVPAPASAGGAGGAGGATGAAGAKNTAAGGGGAAAAPGGAAIARGGAAAAPGGAAVAPGGAPTKHTSGSGGAASPPKPAAVGGAPAAGSPKPPAPATRNTPEHTHAP